MASAARRQIIGSGDTYKLTAARLVWYENLSGVVSCPENI